MSDTTTGRPTTAPSTVSAAATQRAVFERDGFVVVPGPLRPAGDARVSRRGPTSSPRPRSAGPAHGVLRAEPRCARASACCSGSRTSTRSTPASRDLCDGDKLRGAVSRLLGEPAVLFKDKINFKLPGGDGFKPHQDQQAGWSTYAPLFLTALVSIDAATPENGCLELAAGHHRRGLVGEEWKPLTEEDMRRGCTSMPCPTRPGDAVFFDSYAPHRLGAESHGERPGACSTSPTTAARTATTASSTMPTSGRASRPTSSAIPLGPTRFVSESRLEETA